MQPLMLTCRWVIIEQSNSTSILTFSDIGMRLYHRVGSTCYCFLTCKAIFTWLVFSYHCTINAGWNLEVHNLVTLLPFTIWSLAPCQSCALTVTVVFLHLICLIGLYETGVSVIHFMAPSNQQCCKISPFVNTLCTRYPSVNFLKVTNTVTWPSTSPPLVCPTVTCCHFFCLHSRSTWTRALLLHAPKTWGQFQHSKSTKTALESKRWSAPANSCWNIQWGITGFRPRSRWLDVTIRLQLLWSEHRL